MGAGGIRDRSGRGRADDALMVGVAVAALGRGKLTARAARVLKGLSGAVTRAPGAVLPWRPQWPM